MQIAMLSAFVVLLVASTSASTPLSSYGRRLVEANNDFAATLLQQTRQTADGASSTANVILSPFSVMTGLGMLSLGAKNTTALEIRKAMNLKSLSAPKLARGLNNLRLISSSKQFYKLSTADRLWANKGTSLKKVFVRQMGSHFNAAVEELDFRREPAARRRINEWASNVTGGEISELVPPGFISTWTRLILTDAIYFKGTWKSRFNAADTKRMPFRGCDAAAKAPVDMMHQNGVFGYRYAYEERIRVVEMPYVGDAVSMYVLLPDNCEALARLEKNLSASRIRSLISDLHPTTLDIYFPRFELGYRASLARVLRYMGVKAAFSPGQADFSGIDGTRDLYVSDAVHEAVIGVNEDGTKAAAATMIGIRGRSSWLPEVRADRPFLFVIVDKRSSAILFAGRLADPRPFRAGQGKKESSPGPSETRVPDRSPNCDKCPVHRASELSLNEFCDRKFDYVLVGQLQSIQTTNARLRYHLRINRVLKEGSVSIRRGSNEVYLWPKNLYKRCSCGLQRGKRYIIAGHENHKTTKKVLKMDSFIAERIRQSDVDRIKTFVNHCKRRGKM